MAGEFGAPYRAPCDGWPAARKWYLGGIHQHFLTEHSTVAAFENLTRVDDYANPPGADIEPYPRPNDYGLPTCAEAPICTLGNPKCGEWPTSEMPSCVGGQYSIENNCYSSTGTTVDLATCRKIGFKNVQAKRQWHGRFGYLSHDLYDGVSFQKFDRKSDDGTFSPACACNLEFEQSAPDETKYCTSVLSSSYNRTEAGVLTLSGTVMRSSSVNKLSGVLTRNDSCSDETGDTTAKDLARTALDDHIGFTPWDAVLRYRYHVDAWKADGATVTETRSGSTYTISAPTPGDTLKSGTGTLDVAAGSLTIITKRDYSGIPQEIWRDEITFSNTAFEHKYTFTEYSGSPETVWAVSVTSTSGQLTVTNTSDDVYADVKTLLGEWDLTDDAQYPWREDEFVSVAPLVTRNEATAAVSPDDCLDQACGTYTDPNAALRDGTLQGKPLPAGYGPHFDWHHRTWNVCSAGGEAWYIEFYGAWSGETNAGDSTDATVPKTATQWTENYYAKDLSGGAWVRFASGTLQAQKWVETLIKRPSHNYARPCGTDRYLEDADSVRCITGSSGMPISVTIETDGGILTHDQCLVCGTTYDGVYAVTRTDSTTVELSTLTDANVPTRTDGGTGWIGRLRWPEAKPVCGRVAITGASNSSPIQISVGEDLWLRTGDRVTISGCTGNTAANGTRAITRISATVFSLDGSTGNGAYHGSGYVQSENAPPYYWHDSNTKGDYVYAEWQHNFRDYQERERVVAQHTNCENCPDADPANSTLLRTNQASHYVVQSVAGLIIEGDCIAFWPCGPSALCISPNEEEFPHGETRPFYADFVCDERYTSYWQAGIVQHVADPFWQTPPCPCSGGVKDCTGWTADEGDCTGAYHHAPQVEARNEKPADAPEPPAPISIHYLTLDELDQVTAPDGLIAVAPVDVGHTLMLPNATETPWGLWLREYGCVCADGTFADDYTDNGVSC